MPTYDSIVQPGYNIVKPPAGGAPSAGVTDYGEKGIGGGNDPTSPSGAPDAGSKIGLESGGVYTGAVGTVKGVDK